MGTVGWRYMDLDRFCGEVVSRAGTNQDPWTISNL